MDIKGVLVGIRKYSFPDQNTGNIIQGGKLLLAVPSDNAETVGHSISEIPYLYANHSVLAPMVEANTLKPVRVSCDVQLSGRKTKLLANEIKV